MVDASLDADALAYCIALGEEAKAEVPASCRSLPPFGILAAAVRGVAALAVAKSDAEDGIRLQELAQYVAKPGAVVVAHVPGLIPPGAHERISYELHRAFPKNRVLVIEGGVGLDVIAPEEVPEHLAGKVEPAAIVDELHPEAEEARRLGL